MVLLTGGTAGAEIINFAEAKLGQLPEGWIAGVSGNGDPKWAVEADATAPEGFGIASGQHRFCLYHLNLGGLVEEGNPGMLWGGIFEAALKRDFSLRLVAEINGESIRGKRAENFALTGFIRELPGGITLDLAGRVGLSQTAPDWEVREGLQCSLYRTPRRQKVLVC